MSVPATEQDPVFAYFGDQPKRLEVLRSTDYQTFKTDLIDLHNQLVPEDEQESVFNPNQNCTFGGDLFPRPEDKDLLLQYALESAQRQDDIQDSAFILAAATVLTHPFKDGNGRTSRALYARLSRGLKEGDDEYEIVSTKDRRRKDLVDLDALSFLNWPATSLAYKKEGIARYMDAEGAWFESNDTELARRHYTMEREFAGLSEEEAIQLDEMFGTRTGVDGVNAAREGANSESIMFGFSKLAQEEGLELPIKVFQRGDRKITKVVTPDALAMLTGDQKRKLTQYISEYKTHEVKAKIDLLDIYKNKNITYEGVRMSIASFVVDITRNFRASKI